MFKKKSETLASVVETQETSVEAADKAAKLTKKQGEMELTDAQKASVMGGFIATMKNPPIIGDLVEGPVIAVEKSSV